MIWQIDDLWRFQIPEDLRDKWRYPQLTESAKRKILGLNSARLYGLPAAAKPLGSDQGVYKQGGLANYALHMQPGSAIDNALRGPGYPTPIVPVALIPHDNLTKMKKQ